MAGGAARNSLMGLPVADVGAATLRPKRVERAKKGGRVTPLTNIPGRANKNAERYVPLRGVETPCRQVCVPTCNGTTLRPMVGEPAAYATGSPN